MRTVSKYEVDTTKKNLVIPPIINNQGVSRLSTIERTLTAKVGDHSIRNVANLTTVRDNELSKSLNNNAGKFGNI